jgi:hypothetical protein
MATPRPFGSLTANPQPGREIDKYLDWQSLTPEPKWRADLHFEA